MGKERSLYMVIHLSPSALNDNENWPSPLRSTWRCTVSSEVLCEHWEQGRRAIRQALLNADGGGGHDRGREALGDRSQ